MRAFQMEVDQSVMAYLMRLGVPADTPYDVRVRWLGIKMQWEQDGWPEPPPAAAPTTANQRGLWLSPLERRVVDFLTGRGQRTSGEGVASALGLTFNHRFKAIMTNLVDREILDGLPGTGYVVAPVAGGT